MANGQISRRGFIGGVAGASSLAALTSPIRVVRAQGKKVLRTRAKRDIQTLDPGYMTGSVDVEIQDATMPRLAYIVKKGDTYSWTPTEYMERLTQTDPAHFSFALKPGFLWTNGYGELTAEDVKYSLERMTVSDWKDYFVALDHVEITDTYSGVIVLKHPFPAFGLGALAGDPGCLVCKKATEAVGGKYDTKIPASCGPYVVEEWIPKQRVVLSRNPQWTGTSPDFDTIQHHIITEVPAAELAFESGELDITAISPQAMLRYKKEPVAGTKLAVAGYLNCRYVGMNAEHPKLTDVRVRKAIQRAIDKQAVLLAAFSGAAVESHGFSPPGVLGQRTQSGYSHDPDHARELLKEAGAEGLKLNLATMNLQERMNAAQVVQANLAEVDLDVSVIPYDVGPFWNLGREKKGDEWKNLQLFLTGFGAAIDPASNFQWFTKAQIGNWNWERWWDPEFERIYEEAGKEPDQDKRAAMYVRLQEIMENTGAYVWLWHEPETFIHRTEVIAAVTPTGNLALRRCVLG